MSDAANFITQISSSLAYGVRSFMKTELNLFSHAADGWN
jgi:hypothetical protein